MVNVIKLTGYNSPQPGDHWLAKNNRYSFYLGNGKLAVFSSERECKAFLAATNRFLNAKLCELNYLYGCAFVEYRRVWPYFYTGRGKSKELNELHANIAGQISMIEHCFTRLPIDIGPNAAHFAWRWLLECCGCVSAMAGAIAQVHAVKSNAAEQAALATLAAQCAVIRGALEGYSNSVSQ